MFFELHYCMYTLASVNLTGKKYREITIKKCGKIIYF